MVPNVISEVLIRITAKYEWDLQMRPLRLRSTKNASIEFNLEINVNIIL